MQISVFRAGDEPESKFYPRFLGSFELLQVINPVTYMLKLPPNMRIHPIFHVFLLRPAVVGHSMEG